MKKNVDNLVNEEMKIEQQLPASIRSAFDQSYAQIRQQSKKKNKKSWLKPLSVAAAALALSTTVLMTNDTALAKLQAFLGINDSGIETAVEHGDLQIMSQIQQSENITMTLEYLFTDASRLGLQFKIESEQISQNNLYDLDFEYRLFDAEGHEISALVSDTKEIEGTQIFNGPDFQLTTVTNHSATIELLEEANTTTIPSLEGAQLVVETIHFRNKEGGLTSVDGEWSFNLAATNFVTQQLVAENTVPGLTLEQAVLSNGSMKVSYKVDEIIENENDIFETALVNDQGQTFYAKSANVEVLEEQTVISLVLPYSVWNEQQSLSLKVKGYEELKLVKKK